MEDKGALLKGPRVTIRSLTRADLEVMNTWRPTEDPLYRLFDWPISSLERNDVWFRQLVRDESRVYYAVENEHGQLIGRISLREMQRRRSARLGMGLSAPFVGQGYGTEALQVFLRYFFLELRFQRMVLDVAAINERAIRCYQRCGFKNTGSTYKDLEGNEDISFLKEERYEHLKRFFQISSRYQRMLFYDMVLEKRDWLELWQSETASNN